MEEEKKLYIGNLDYGVTDEDIQELLKENEIEYKEVNIIKDKFTGRSRGFGFAEFETAEAAQSAVDKLDGHDIKGRALKVSKARARTPRAENKERF